MPNFQYDHMLGAWESPPSVIKAQCDQQAEGIIWLGRKVHHLKKANRIDHLKKKET